MNKFSNHITCPLGRFKSQFYIKKFIFKLCRLSGMKDYFHENLVDTIILNNCIERAQL